MELESNNIKYSDSLESNSEKYAEEIARNFLQKRCIL